MSFSFLRFGPFKSSLFTGKAAVWPAIFDFYGRKSSGRRSKKRENSPPPQWKRCCSALRRSWDSCWRAARRLLLLRKGSSLSWPGGISPKCAWSCRGSPGGVWTWGEMCWGEVVRTRTARYPWRSEGQYCERESFIKGREKTGERKDQRRAKLKVRRWTWCSVCEGERQGERSARKNQKASALTSMPSAVCGGRTSKLFSLERVSLPPVPPHSLTNSLTHTHTHTHVAYFLPLSRTHTHTPPCFSIRSSIMLESAVGRYQAADPPQLLQGDSVPPPPHQQNPRSGPSTPERVLIRRDFRFPLLTFFIHLKCFNRPVFILVDII